MVVIDASFGLLYSKDMISFTNTQKISCSLWKQSVFHLLLSQKLRELSNAP